MRLDFDDIKSFVRTKSEASSVIKALWLARSAIEIQVKGKRKPIFGFAASFSQTQCETSSLYELVEHVVFLPYAHNEKSMNDIVTHHSRTNDLKENNNVVGNFLIGSKGPKGTFYGNGCSIFTSTQGAILHSQRELFERHLCCEIWYKRSRPLFKEETFQVTTINRAVVVKLYTTPTHNNDYFSIAALECAEDGFFVLGAAIRENVQKACEHAVSEAGMLFEDFKQGRDGSCSSDASRQKILSLRDPGISQQRKIYWQSLIDNKSSGNSYISPELQTITFEPFSNIYAARTFSSEALDPRQFEELPGAPLMPLF